jgi:uncharacterized membrane protein HdeD (DUF308 family)
MKSIGSRYDKLAQSTTLNGAILSLILGMFFLCYGLFFETEKFARTRDTDWLWLALVSMVLGLLGVIHGVLLLHAIHRHLILESHNSG